MSRTKKFVLNSISTAIYQIVLMISGFVLPWIIINYYGSEINGLISSINQFIVYFSLVEAGLSGATVYALYKPLAESDFRSINGVISAAKKMYTQSGLIFLVLTFCFAFVYPSFVKTTSLSNIDIILLALILGTNGALDFFTLSKYRALLTADQRTYVISFASIVYNLVNIIIIVVLAKLNVNIVILRAIALLSIFIRSLILIFYVKSKYKYIDYNEKPNTNALEKRWDVLYLQILGAIQSGAPLIILTVVLKNLKLISVYTIYDMIVAGLNGVLGIFISGLSASFGEIIAGNDEKTLKKAYREFELSYYSLITITYSLAFALIMPFIRIYTKDIVDINYNTPIVGFLFVLNGLLNNMKTPQGMLVISAGLYKETKKQTTIQGIIAVIGGIILAKIFGVIGVLCAMILSNTYRVIDLILFAPKYITKLPYRNTVYRLFRVVVCAMIIVVPTKFVKINPNDYLSWILYATVIGVYAVIIVLLSDYLFDKNDLMKVFYRIKLLLKGEKTM